ncbi:MAG: D-alanyl-D-alanine carboxypeptidase [Lachnospiraceae bacterium]|nr:D-alanyl-D-alanine carboxypeptidase [Lachnospiraceae bacterium]
MSMPRGLRKVIALGLLAAFTVSCLSGCGDAAYLLPYSVNAANSGLGLLSATEQTTAATFASDLSVVENDVNTSALNLTTDGEIGALFSLEDQSVLYANGALDRVHPASLTKVLTALVAIKHGKQDDVLTATENVKITESGAQLLGLNAGDTMTLDQALRILLLYSANDVAIMIAEHYGGSVEGFCEMMNEEAAALGATQSYFENPNGLTSDNHLVSAYDLYLIFHEACKYDLFREIISMSSYSTVYYTSAGKEKSFEKNSTNAFITGAVSAPTNVHVVGGKTGTTNAAGHCLILLSRDASGNEYISVILKAESSDALWSDMTSLLALIPGSGATSSE